MSDPQRETGLKTLADFGWVCEPTDEGGVCLRRSAAWQWSMTGCSLFFVLILGGVAAAAIWLLDDLWPNPPEPVWKTIGVVFTAAIIGGYLFCVALAVAQTLEFALVREDWTAGRNRLVTRWRLPEYVRTREFSNAELVLEPHFLPRVTDLQWGVSVCCDGERHRLLRGTRRSFGYMRSEDARCQAELLADALAGPTGWSVRTVEVTGDEAATPPTALPEDELLAALRRHRYRIDVDRRLRLTIRPPRRNQWITGGVLLAVGAGWTSVMVGAATSFVNDAQAQGQPVMHLLFWLIMAPLLMVGVGLCGLGIIILCGDRCWVADDNLFAIHSRLWGWSREQEYVDSAWQLVRVHRQRREGMVRDWQLQAVSRHGRCFEVLLTDHDDDLPRLLGALLSQRTGWPLHDREVDPELAGDAGAVSAQ